MAVELPLFPLGTVLFPHMPLALHIFEERYRKMMHDCREAGTSFGVIAIREGREVGPRAVPWSVGTLAQIRDVETLPDGRYNLVVVGASRFRVDAFSRSRPYLCGTIHYLQDGAASPDDAASLARTLTSQFRRYVEAMRPGGEAIDAEIELPEEPELLSYLVSAAVKVDVARRQELLEMDRTEDRLRACIALLRREQTFLDQMLTPRERAGSVSLN